MSASTIALLPLETITHRILLLRGQKVLLDADLAALYGVETRRLNEQVRRNRERFPEDFIFKLTTKEVEEMNRSQFATGSQKHRDPRFAPFAFTEHGAIMAATILKSQRAAEVSVWCAPLWRCANCSPATRSWRSSWPNWRAASSASWIPTIRL